MIATGLCIYTCTRSLKCMCLLMIPNNLYFYLSIPLRFLVIISCVGNGAVLITSLRKRKNLKPIDLLTVNLAVCDLLVCLIGYPLPVVSGFGNRVRLTLSRLGPYFIELLKQKKLLISSTTFCCYQNKFASQSTLSRVFLFLPTLDMVTLFGLEKIKIDTHGIGQV